MKNAKEGWIILLLILCSIYMSLTPMPEAFAKAAFNDRTVILLSESFTNDTFPPPGWAVYDYNAADVWIRDTGSYSTPPASASHSSDSSNFLDGWLVTPRIFIPSDDCWLSFNQRGKNVLDYYYHGIYVSTGNSDPFIGDFYEVMEPPLPPEDAWTSTPIRVNLGAFVGEEINLAFRYYGLHGDIWWIDDVEIICRSSTTLTLYVKPGAVGDCSDWDHACDLQIALASSFPGDAIWVAAGTYKPTTDSDRSISFQLGSGVKIYGGFPTGGGDWALRDPLTNITALSGDINDTPSDTADDSLHVIYGNGLDSSTIVDGFTITSGNASGGPTLECEWGGGLYCFQCDLALENIKFVKNEGKAGAGLFVNYGNPVLSNVEFVDNVASINGGGMHTHNGAKPILTDVIFSGNEAVNGGGLMNYLNNDSVLTNVQFLDNYAWSSGGGIFNASGSDPFLNDVVFSGNDAYQGGGMYNSNSNPILTNDIFVDNNAEQGGGIFNEISDPIITNVTLTGNSSTDGGEGGGMYNYWSSPNLTGVNFNANFADNSGGGMFNYSSSPTLTGVTFNGNSTYISGGGMFNELSNPTLHEVLFDANESGGDGGGMYNYSSSPNLTGVIFNTNFADNSGGGMYNNLSNPILRQVLFDTNQTGGDGGGMYNLSCNPVLKESTLFNNAALHGGAMANYFSNPTIENSTYSFNHAIDGGAIYNWSSSPIILYSTIVGNNGGIYNHLGSSPLITGTILWGNVIQIYNNEVTSIPAVTFSDIQGGYSGEGNINLDPLLQPLADNGGFTMTHALGTGSPAIDTGSPTTCLLTDQRGFFRPIDGDDDVGARCDMGSYEFGSAIFNFLPLIMK